MDKFQTELARAYFKLLTSLDWEDEVLIGGLKEGLNKFLSNAHLRLCGKGNKYHKTHFISKDALVVLESGVWGGLVWEHLVPKQHYIQNECEQAAAAGTLTLRKVRALMKKYWWTATITNAEDITLAKRSMPESWDKVNILARYQAAGIKLIPNPNFAVK